MILAFPRRRAPLARGFLVAALSLFALVAGPTQAAPPTPAKSKAAAAPKAAPAEPAGPVLAGPREVIFGQDEIYTALYEDSLVDLAPQKNVGYVELVGANPRVDRLLPGAGTRIVIPGRHVVPDVPREGIVVNLGDMRLYRFNAAGALIASFPLGIGREGKETPMGATKVVRKAENPTWRPTASTRRDKPWLPASVGPGPDNPLGTRALYLGWPAYLIHGTNTPRGIGRSTSRGCIRMQDEDVRQLYPAVAVGTSVRVVDQPVKVARDPSGPLWLEVHYTRAQAQQLELNDPVDGANPEALSARLRAAAGADAERIDWGAVRDAVNQRSGLPVDVLTR